NWGSRLLLTNDDTRFPVLARDVLVKGHWLLPALPDGTFHLVKPPLAVWLIAIASWPTGSVSVRTAVLPSLLAAIGVILLTYWLGCRLFGPDPGVIGGLTVATTVGVYTMAHSSMPDMVQLIAGTGAIAVYVAAGFAAKRAWLVLFYGLICLLAGVGVILLAYWLGCRLLGPDPGVIGGLTVATTVGVYTMAHSSMPDMVQLIAGTGAIAVYVAAGFAAKRAWLVLFYGLIGL